MRAIPLPQSARQAWENFYSDEFDLIVDLSHVVVPSDPDGFSRIIVVAENVTVKNAIQACEQYFEIETNLIGLDDITDERSTREGSYAIRVRESIEPDRAMMRVSALRLSQARIPTMTLLERLIYGLKYFKETGNHLDRTYWMLCSGSRTRDGRVPRLRCQAGYRLRIIHAAPEFGQQKLRPRMVVDQ